MSEHKTGLSNWTAKQKADYWDRRNKGLRGQVGYVKYHQTVKDEKDKETHVPLGKIGSHESQFMQPNAWQAVNAHRQGFVQKQHKARGRGE